MTSSPHPAVSRHLLEVPISYRHSTALAFTPDMVFWKDHWSHEIGHVLGLLHTYGNYTNEDPGREACTGSPEYLSDVFDLYNYWCSGDYPPGCNQCYFRPNQTAPVDAAVGDGNTNNIMGNHDINDFISPLQMGKMHRGLMTTSASQYAVGYGPEPIFVDADETWDWRMKVYQDVIVMPGKTLTVNCEIHMVPGSRIIVEAGGRLILDGGVITSPRHATERWQGIQLEGNGSLSQGSSLTPPFPDFQGYLELRNGSRIENAQIGVYVGDGTTSGGGGVVHIAGNPFSAAGSFINCRTAIEFTPYSDAGQPNRSILDFVQFIRLSAYLPESDADPNNIAPFVKVDGIDGLTFKGCSFGNMQPGVTQSHLLGHGISAMDSRILVIPGCPGNYPCAAAEETLTRFFGLDHAVEAFSTGTGRTLTIRGAEFMSNIAGVYTNGVTGVNITECDFTVGDNTTTMTNPDEQFWYGYRRGIYTYNSWGLRIRDNHMSGWPSASTNTEGIVIGYSRDHNEVIYKNEIEELTRAFVGEGICAETFNGNEGMIGLQFRCNTNQTNDINITSRKVSSAFELEQQLHTIRTNQGFQVAADNRFDNWPQTDPVRWDYYVDTDWLIRYRYRNTNPVQLEYQPVSYDPDRVYLLDMYRPNQYNPFCLWYYEEPGAARNRVGFGLQIAQQKLAYGNTRYLYEQLLDGGSTDEVVQEISSAWPNEAWELRTYLLNLSPYLTVEALKVAVNKAYFPMAMKAEICIANPDATQKDGFVKWLESYANEPMPGYLIDMIKASWNSTTYRTELEMELADQHTVLTQTAHELLDVLERDSSATIEDNIWVWQQIRTTAARYAEAALRLGTGNYTAARNVVLSIPTEHDLKDPEWLEQQRMLGYIDLLDAATQNGRDHGTLLPAELDALRALRNDAHDRPSNWINNLVCRYYHDCLAPLTGGEEVQPKRMQSGMSLAPDLLKNSYVTAPNPAEVWVSFTYTFLTARQKAVVHVQDALGRTVATLPLPNDQGQVVLDTRQLGAGVYTVCYMNAGMVEQTDKLIVR